MAADNYSEQVKKDNANAMDMHPARHKWEISQRANLCIVSDKLHDKRNTTHFLQKTENKPVRSAWHVANFMMITQISSATTTSADQWFSPDFELLVQLVNLPDQLHVLRWQSPPVAEEHEAYQEQRYDQERRASASADPHTIDSHHSYLVPSRSLVVTHAGTYATLSSTGPPGCRGVLYARAVCKQYLRVTRGFSLRH